MTGFLKLLKHSILFFPFYLKSEPYPIQFSIPECKIVQEIPQKEKDFAFIVPGVPCTYIYDDEQEYYKEYQRSYFAVTSMKWGWDCLRHYEILANGCIPYFIDLDKCDESTMAFLPKELILEAMNLKGVSFLRIDFTKFDYEKYYQILEELLEHTRKYLTTKQMACYVLKKVNYFENGKILFLSGELNPDYLRCLMLIGLKELLQDRIVDVPKVEHVYRLYSGNIQKLYGKGMSYTRIIEDVFVDRENIAQRIANKEFDLIIYGSVHRGLPFHNLVLLNYKPEKVLYFCGEDFHDCQFIHFPNFFLREFQAYYSQFSE